MARWRYDHSVKMSRKNGFGTGDLFEKADGNLERRNARQIHNAAFRRGASKKTCDKTEALREGLVRNSAFQRPARDIVSSVKFQRRTQRSSPSSASIFSQMEWRNSRTSNLLRIPIKLRRQTLVLAKSRDCK